MEYTAVDLIPLSRCAAGVGRLQKGRTVFKGHKTQSSRIFRPQGAIIDVLLRTTHPRCPTGESMLSANSIGFGGVLLAGVSLFWVKRTVY